MTHPHAPIISAGQWYVEEGFSKEVSKLSVRMFPRYCFCLAEVQVHDYRPTKLSQICSVPTALPTPASLPLPQPPSFLQAPQCEHTFAGCLPWLFPLCKTHFQVMVWGASFISVLTQKSPPREAHNHLATHSKLSFSMNDSFFPSAYLSISDDSTGLLATRFNQWSNSLSKYNRKKKTIQNPYQAS